ncbi:DUF5666 domain-containing protein [Terriglobus albidus]|uniref:DUF5666 domain-containing protein n=1 Tax=Terriglobus albidus TaxID=1592106 RepID=UPI001C9C1D3A|nr:DUF5666 domain-containing protein [Terriglobus albidus]
MFATKRDFLATLFTATAVVMTVSPCAVAQNASALGTVKSVDGKTMTVATDKGATVTVTLGDTTKVVQLAPGSTDLKTAQPATASDITAGDRVLASGPGDASAITAVRVVLMKSGDIAQRNAATQADWARRGSGGLVNAVNGGSISIKQGQKVVEITTTPKTIFRRYAADSVKFEDTKPGTLSDIRPGDQLRVRGEKNEDGTAIAADEIVSGAFRNLAGTVTSVDAASGKIVLKDLASKKNVTVMVTSNSDFRALPPQMAAMLAARARGAANGAAGANGGGAPGGAPQGGGVSGGGAPQGMGRPAGGGEGAVAGSGGMGPGGAGGGRGFGGPGGGGPRGDLASMLSRLPTGELATVKNGDALMIVGTGAANADTVTAVTMLSGVEPILAAPNGASSMNLAPWSMGGGAGGDAQ